RDLAREIAHDVTRASGAKPRASSHRGIARRRSTTQRRLEPARRFFTKNVQRPGDEKSYGRAAEHGDAADLHRLRKVSAAHAAAGRRIFQSAQRAPDEDDG